MKGFHPVFGRSRRGLARRSAGNGTSTRLRRTTLGCLALSTTLLAAACGGSGGSGGNAAGGSGDSGKSTPLVIAWNSTPDVSYEPLLAAIDTLKKQGYNISAQTLSGADVVAQALATNRADMTYNNVTGVANAVAKGVPIKIVSDGSANDVAWVVKSGYEDCNKLNGQPVGIFGPAASSGYTKQMLAYFKQKCPDVQPNYVTIPDSSLRAQALAHGQIVGTMLVRSDAESLQKKLDPNGKYTVSLMKKTFPGLSDNYIFATESAIKGKSAAITAFIKAELDAVKKFYSDPNALQSAIKTDLGDKAYDPESAQSSVQTKLWYADGDLDQAGKNGLDQTLQLFGLPGSSAQLIDRSLLDKALKGTGK